MAQFRAEAAKKYVSLNEAERRAERDRQEAQRKQRQAERKALREEYLADWRRSTIDVLENTYIDHGDGRITKLPKKKR